MAGLLWDECEVVAAAGTSVIVIVISIVLENESQDGLGFWIFDGR